MSRQQRIFKLLTEKLSPAQLIVEDESHRHHVPENAETHFKITIVSNCFSDMSRIARHRLVNALLVDEVAAGLHAFSMHLYTPEEFTKNNNIPASPACRGGRHHDQH